MNLKPEQIPDEVVEAACAALAVAMEFGDTWPGDYAEDQQNELRQAIRQTLAAALPVLLVKLGAVHGYRAGGSCIIRWEDKPAPIGTTFYTLPTQDTPNER